MVDKAITHFSAEAKGEVSSKQAHLVLYDKIKGGLPEQMKVSPISAIPHKSKAFRSTLDLSFFLRLIPQGCVPLVNEKSDKKSTGGAINQIGHVLLNLIRAFTEAPECANIFQGK